MKKLIPSLITLCGLLIGCIGIYFVLLEDRNYAIYFVLAASILDFLDGWAARKLKVVSKVGKELDSLADMVSFGVLPAMFMISWFEEINNWSNLFIFFPTLITLFSAIRLARFNVDSLQSQNFIGLATPANAIMICSLAWLDMNINIFFLLVFCCLSCVLLVAPIKMFSFKIKELSWKGNKEKISFFLICLLLLIIFRLRFVPFLVPLYILWNIVFNRLKVSS